MPPARSSKGLGSKQVRSGRGAGVENVHADKVSWSPPSQEAHQSHTCVCLLECTCWVKFNPCKRNWGIPWRGNLPLASGGIFSLRRPGGCVYPDA